MRPIRVVVTALLFLSALLAEEIPAGTRVMLTMMNSITTATAQEGDSVYATTATPVTVNDQIVIPVGSYVQGVVAHAKRSGKVSGRAEMALRLETVTLPGGKVLKFTPAVNSVDSGGTAQRASRGDGDIKQGSDAGTDAARIAILAGSGASLGGWVDSGWKGAGIGAAAGSAVGVATAMFTRGHEVELRRGTSLDVVFSRAVPIL